MEIMTALLAAVAALFPLMNPVGNTPIFFSITANDTPQYRRRQALKIAINVFVILTVCLLGGRYILAMFGLSVPILRLAGGLVVGHSLAWELVQTFLTARFSGAERHCRRLAKIEELEMRTGQSMTLASQSPGLHGNEGGNHADR